MVRIVSTLSVGETGVDGAPLVVPVTDEADVLS